MQNPKPSSGEPYVGREADWEIVGELYDIAWAPIQVAMLRDLLRTYDDMERYDWNAVLHTLSSVRGEMRQIPGTRFIRGWLGRFLRLVQGGDPEQSWYVGLAVLIVQFASVVSQLDRQTAEKVSWIANGIVPWMTDEGLRLLLVKLVTAGVPRECLDNIVSTWRVDEGTTGVHDETLTLGELYLAFVSRDVDSIRRAMASLRERHPDSANSVALMTYGVSSFDEHPLAPLPESRTRTEDAAVGVAEPSHVLLQSIAEQIREEHALTRLRLRQVTDSLAAEMSAQFAVLRDASEQQSQRERVMLARLETLSRSRGDAYVHALQQLEEHFGPIWESVSGEAQRNLASGEVVRESYGRQEGFDPALATIAYTRALEAELSIRVIQPMMAYLNSHGVTPSARSRLLVRDVAGLEEVLKGAAQADSRFTRIGDACVHLWPDRAAFLENELPGRLKAIRPVRNDAAHGRSVDRNRLETVRSVIVGPNRAQSTRLASHAAARRKLSTRRD